MQVNTTNAALVAALFEVLADARFQLRSPSAVKNAAARRECIVEEEAILALATEAGCPILHRNRDGAPLITRPIIADGSRRMTWTEARGLSDAADAVAGGAEAFEAGTYRPTFADDTRTVFPRDEDDGVDD